MAKFKMYIRHRKYFVGDEIEYRVFNEIRHGTVIKAPDAYYCDSHAYGIDYYIVSNKHLPPGKCSVISFIRGGNFPPFPVGLFPPVHIWAIMLLAWWPYPLLYDQYPLPML